MTAFLICMAVLGLLNVGTIMGWLADGNYPRPRGFSSMGVDLSSLAVNALISGYSLYFLLS